MCRGPPECRRLSHRRWIGLVGPQRSFRRLAQAARESRVTRGIEKLLRLVVSAPPTNCRSFHSKQKALAEHARFPGWHLPVALPESRHRDSAEALLVRSRFRAT